MSEATELRDEFQGALGYYELAMWDDALAEIDALQQRLASGAASMIELNEFRLVVLQGAKRWAQMRGLAEACARSEPTRASWFISWAFALRREQSIPDARRVLLQAAVVHPGEALIAFNLACYAAQLGELEEARRCLDRALGIDPLLKTNAQEDPDLEPIRAPAP